MREMKIYRSVTSRNDRSVESYLKDIAKERQLTPDEEVVLSLRVKKGDQEALDLLVRGNLRFVVSTAKNYQGRGIELCDLISAGNLGLIKAATRFDPSRGFKFCSYAVWWIRQSILQSIDLQSNLVTLPANQMALLGKARRRVMLLEQELQRVPTLEEVEEAMGDEKVLLDWLGAGAKSNSSIDRPVADGSDSTAADMLIDEDAPRPDDGVANESLNLLLKKAIKQLPVIDRRVIQYIFGIGVDREYSIEETAMLLGVTCERIRQLLKHGLKNLRDSPYIKQLMEEWE
jgi:RNA polymerase primary sigma factor